MSTNFEDRTPVQRMRILLAEDDPLSRDLVTRVLTRAGHEVTAAKTGPEAVDAFGGAEFDVVVMDVHLPGMDGLAATAAIRAAEAAGGTHTPILALTAQADASDRRRCLDAGMDGYLTKPFEIRELIAAVEGAPAALNTAHVDAAATHGSADAIVDWNAARETVAGDTALLRRMAAMFIDLSAAMEDDVRRAVAARDPSALQRSAHKLKGSVTHFAASRTIAAARTLERAGEAGEFEGVDGRLTELESALAELREALEAGPPRA